MEDLFSIISSYLDFSFFDFVNNTSEALSVNDLLIIAQETLIPFETVENHFVLETISSVLSSPYKHFAFANRISPWRIELTLKLIDFCEAAERKPLYRLDMFGLFKSWADAIKSLQYDFKSVQELRHDFPNKLDFELHCLIHRMALPERKRLSFIVHKVAPELPDDGQLLPSQAFLDESLCHPGFAEVRIKRDRDNENYVRIFRNLFCAVASLDETWAYIDARNTNQSSQKLAALRSSVFLNARALSSSVGTLPPLLTMNQTQSCLNITEDALSIPAIRFHNAQVTERNQNLQSIRIRMFHQRALKIHESEKEPVA